MFFHDFVFLFSIFPIILSCFFFQTVCVVCISSIVVSVSYGDGDAVKSSWVLESCWKTTIKRKIANFLNIFSFLFVCFPICGFLLGIRKRKSELLNKVSLFRYSIYLPCASCGCWLKGHLFLENKGWRLQQSVKRVWELLMLFQMTIVSGENISLLNRIYNSDWHLNRPICFLFLLERIVVSSNEKQRTRPKYRWKIDA